MARARGTTRERGYSGQHPKLRAQWQPIVDAGRAYCHATICVMLTRWIQPGTPWNLGHTPDRDRWTGPEHERCNKSDGARRGNRMRRQARHEPPQNWRTSRAW
jgi:hypothetical protein